MPDETVDVLLICPNYYSKVLITNAIMYPSNLAYLAAYLRDRNIKVSIIDGRAYNYSLEDYKRDIRRFRPKIVGITVMTSCVNQSVDIAKAVKEMSRDILVVVGGAHISALPMDTLRDYADIDVAVVGEGEETLFELAESILHNSRSFDSIAGIYYRHNGEIKHTNPRALIENLDSLPYPAYDLLPLEKYSPSFQWIKKLPLTMVYTSRGCPYRCTFCAGNSNFGNKVRYRSAENVIAEIEFRIKQYGVRQVIFYDDMFIVNRNNITRICDLMITKKLDIVWGCLSSISAMDKELALKMKQAGCFTIFFGLESCDESMLRRMKKNYTSFAKAKTVLADVKKAGIETVASFIFGTPGETEQTIEKTIKLAMQLPLNYSAAVPVVPFPGSQLFNYARTNNILPKVITDWSRFEAIKEPFQLSEVSVAKLNYYTSLFFRRFYFRLPIIFEIAINNISYYKIWHGLKTAGRIIQLIFRYTRAK